MAVYRNDPDLNLLGKCSNEELQLLVSILTTDPRDGDTRWTESLTSTPEYRLLAPDHRRYWQLIAAEFQRYGANTLASLVRLGQGVTYREILVDVCDKLDVNYNQKSTTETIELALLMKVLEKSLDQMSPEELAAFSHNMHLDLTNPTHNSFLLPFRLPSGLPRWLRSSWQRCCLPVSSPPWVVLPPGELLWSLHVLFPFWLVLLPSH